MSDNNIDTSTITIDESDTDSYDASLDSFLNTSTYSINSPSYTYSVSGYNGVTLTSPTTSGIYTTGWNDSAGLSNVMTVKGDANIDGELTIQGVKLSDRLNKIEERLGILRPNQELEEKWDRLKSLGQMYRELEAEILEKEKIWGILKK